MVANRCGHAAHAGRIRRRELQRPRITGGVPNPFPATGLEPEVVGSLRSEARALSLAPGQLDRSEIKAAGAAAGGRNALHLITPVRAGQASVRHDRLPVLPCRTTALEVGVSGPSGAAVEHAPGRRRPSDRDARRRIDLGRYVTSQRSRAERIAIELEHAQAAEREVRLIARDNERPRRAGTARGRRRSRHRELGRTRSTSHNSRPHSDRDDRDDRSTSRSPRDHRQTQMPLTDRCRGRQTCGQLR